MRGLVEVVAWSVVYLAILNAAAWVADEYPTGAVAGAAYIGVIALAMIGGAILRDQGRGR